MRKPTKRSKAVTPRELEAKIMSVLRREGFKFNTNRLFDHIINVDNAVKEKIEFNISNFANLLHEELKL